MRVAASAHKHGINDLDVMAAVEKALLRIALDDSSPQRQLILGFDTAARLLEIVVLTFDDGREAVAVHAMSARKQYRALLRERSSLMSNLTPGNDIPHDLSDEQINAIAEEAEEGYDVEFLRSRIGRPRLDITGPAHVVPVRLTPAQLAKLDQRVARDRTTRSEALRAAVDAYLAS